MRGGEKKKRRELGREEEGRKERGSEGPGVDGCLGLGGCAGSWAAGGWSQAGMPGGWRHKGPSSPPSQPLPPGTRSPHHPPTPLGQLWGRVSGAGARVWGPHPDVPLPKRVSWPHPHLMGQVQRVPEGQASLLHHWKGRLSSPLLTPFLSSSGPVDGLKSKHFQRHSPD